MEPLPRSPSKLPIESTIWNGLANLRMSKSLLWQKVLTKHQGLITQYSEKRDEAHDSSLQRIRSFGEPYFHTYTRLFDQDC